MPEDASETEPAGVASQPASLKLHEETLSVTKREVAAGTTRVSTRTETHEEIAEVELERDTVDVVRVPIGRIIDAAPQVRTEGGVTIVPIVEERLVMTKQLFLVEELHIERRTTTEVARTSVPLRRQRAIIERIDADGRPETDEAPAEG